MTLVSLALLTTAQAAPVKIVGVEAKSSYLKGSTSYPASAVKDGKSKPWFEGDAGNGVGAWIEVDLGGEHKVSKIQVFAGDWSTRDSWGQANRPAEVEVRWSDGTVDIWSMSDELTVQTFSPSAPKATSKIRLKFNSLHSGTAFPDTAISEILVFDDQPGSSMYAATATASSEYPADGDGAYHPIHASDGVRDTMWCEGVADGDGVGEWVEFDLGSAVSLKGMKVCAGMCSGFDMFKKGNAPTKLTAMFSDGSSEEVTLKELPLPQAVRFDSAHTTSTVKLRIDAVRAGSEFNDSCISDVEFSR